MPIRIPAELPAEITPEPATEANYVWLDELEPAESKQYGICDFSVDDTVGNTYLGHVAWLNTKSNPDSQQAYSTYYLGGKYKKLTGTVAVSVDTAMEQKGALFFYCDDEVVYNMDSIGRTTAPIKFEIDVENQQWLKIYNETGNRGTNGDNFLLLFYNCKLEK